MAIQQTSVCIHYLNLSSISKAVPFPYMLHFLTLVNQVIWALFRKFIDRNVPMYIIKILCYRHQHQLKSVRWGCFISNVFNVTNVLRQGCILSLKPFNIYIDGLSNILNHSLIGGSLGGRRINHMLYADDLCIVSLSSVSLQKNMLSICEEYCANHAITFNVKKICRHVLQMYC